jgi:anti-sigma regulatory factor (Ser/Thr protein kinase)
VWRLNAPPGLDERWPAEVSSVAPIRDAVRRFAASAGAGRGMIDDVALAVTEATTNAVVHADARTITIVGIAVDHVLTIDVTDDGAGIAPDLERGGLGLGLAIIGRLSDELRIGAAPGGGTRVGMRFSL